MWKYLRLLQNCIKTQTLHCIKSRRKKKAKESFRNYGTLLILSLVWKKRLVWGFICLKSKIFTS